MKTSNGINVEVYRWFGEESVANFSKEIRFKEAPMYDNIVFHMTHEWLKTYATIVAHQANKLMLSPGCVTALVKYIYIYTHD